MMLKPLTWLSAAQLASISLAEQDAHHQFIGLRVGPEAGHKNKKKRAHHFFQEHDQDASFHQSAALVNKAGTSDAVTPEEAAKPAADLPEADKKEGAAGDVAPAEEPPWSVTANWSVVKSCEMENEGTCSPPSTYQSCLDNAQNDCEQRLSNEGQEQCLGYAIEKPQDGEAPARLADDQVKEGEQQKPISAVVKYKLLSCLQSAKKDENWDLYTRPNHVLINEETGLTMQTKIIIAVVIIFVVAGGAIAATMGQKKETSVSGAEAGDGVNIVEG